MLRENYSKYWKMMVLFQRNRFVRSVFSIGCLYWKLWKFFFCTLPGLGMIHVGSTITDLASFSIYVSEYKKFHFPSYVMICFNSTWGFKTCFTIFCFTIFEIFFRWERLHVSLWRPCTIYTLIGFFTEIWNLKIFFLEKVVWWNCVILGM